MTSAAKRMGSVKGPLAIAIGMLLLMVFLLVMSNRTGQRTFELAKQELDSLEAVNVRIDGALFMSLFELQMDFDLLAQLQAEMREAGEALARVFPAAGDYQHHAQSARPGDRRCDQSLKRSQSVHLQRDDAAGRDRRL